MSLRLVDHVAASVVGGVPLERLLAEWGSQAAQTGPELLRPDWLAWAGQEEPPGWARLGVQRLEQPGGGPGPLVVWESWSCEGVRPEVACAVTAGDGWMLALAGTPAQAQLLHAVDGVVAASASTQRAQVSGAAPQRVLRALQDNGGAQVLSSVSGLRVVLEVAGVELDALSPDAVLLPVRVATRPFEHAPGPAPSMAGTAVPVFPAGDDEVEAARRPVRGGAVGPGHAVGRLPR
ncbi:MULTISPECIES: hypothetical protein [Actinosynnema]|uniref:hypothetical protein n=1 Tax=Actinosynnema TaxID=40566 RepID=UPI0020A33E7A|nr:hypothetical protein [Actinosynnema pretiosum]MCP2097361.1 hypothetical protein [Actinosynnema pretiosum]